MQPGSFRAEQSQAPQTAGDFPKQTTQSAHRSQGTARHYPGSALRRLFRGEARHLMGSTNTRFRGPGAERTEVTQGRGEGKQQKTRQLEQRQSRLRELRTAASHLLTVSSGKQQAKPGQSDANSPKRALWAPRKRRSWKQGPALCHPRAERPRDAGSPPGGDERSHGTAAGAHAPAGAVLWESSPVLLLLVGWGGRMGTPQQHCPGGAHKGWWPQSAGVVQGAGPLRPPRGSRARQ